MIEAGPDVILCASRCANPAIIKLGPSRNHVGHEDASSSDAAVLAAKAAQEVREQTAAEVHTTPQPWLLSLHCGKQDAQCR